MKNPFNVLERWTGCTAIATGLPLGILFSYHITIYYTYSQQGNFINITEYINKEASELDFAFHYKKKHAVMKLIGCQTMSRSI